MSLRSIVRSRQQRHVQRRRLVLEQLDSRLVLSGESFVGDFNGDGFVNAPDIALLQAEISNPNPDVGTFDLTGNGHVTSCDVDAFHPKPGDINLDEFVDARDAAQFAANFGAEVANWSSGDFDGDGGAGLSDLAWMQRYFGFAPSLSAAVREAVRQAFVGTVESAQQGEVESWVVGYGCERTRSQIDPLETVLNDLDSQATIEPVPGLPDAFRWTPPAGVDPTSVIALLSTSENVEFYYPEVRVEVPLDPPEPMAIPNDPYYDDQWHLPSIGVEPVWDTYRGAGVVVGVVDNGVQHSHPDLAANYRADLSRNFNAGDSGDADATRGQCLGGVNLGNCHGTAVAGVIAAEGFNGLGMSGVAPEAELAGLRLLAGSVTDRDIATALSHERDSIDIYNNSWGFHQNGRLVTTAYPSTLARIENNARNGRGHLGSIYVWAAGNRSNNGSPDNVNYGPLTNSRFGIAVGAIGDNDRAAGYSTPGASVLVSAPSAGGTQRICTTDLLGSDGYNYSADASDGDAFGDLNYTCRFGGTSAAAPVVSGVIALMLEANPLLTARDVQAILLQTARQNDPTDPEWSLNGAGYHVNHKYGFGAVDAAAAVDAARTWSNLPAEVSYQSPRANLRCAGEPQNRCAIPDNDPVGVESTIVVDEDLAVEWIEVSFDATHDYRGDLEVVLVSPSGTISRLAEQRFTDTGDNYRSWVFTSVRHWGESSLGTWTLQVRDRDAGVVGTFDSWRLSVHGMKPRSPEIAVSYIGVNIATGDTTPDAGDGTDFGEALQFGMPIQRTFVIRNTGSATLVLGSPSVPSGFRLVEGLSSTVRPGHSDSFTVELLTDAPGDFSGVIEFATNDDGGLDRVDENPFRFAVSGKVSKNTPIPPNVVAPIGDLVVNEDAPAIDNYVDLDDVFEDDTYADEQLVYSIRSNSHPTVVDVVPDAANRLDLSFFANEFQESPPVAITVRATNPTGAFVEDTFSIMVRPVNDPPSFSVAPADLNITVNAGAGPQSFPNWATDISFGPPNEAPQALSFVITENTNPSLFDSLPAISPDGMLTFTPAASVPATGSAQITVELRDSGGTEFGGDDTSIPRSFTIAVALPPRSIGGRVWHDLDADGIQDAGEPGIAGAVAELFRTTDSIAGNADDVSLGMGVTDGSGAYSFNGVVAGSYYVTLNPPVGFGFTANDAGDDDALDSDVDPATGRTAIFTIAGGENLLDIDAGLVGTSAIRGTKFNDVDGNGARDAGEEGLAGWTIYADLNENGQFDAGEPNDVTDVNGDYAINVPPGTHTVREMQQAGWTQTFPRTGFGGSGQLSSVQTLPVPSDSIAISNDGRHLYAAEEDESRLSVYARDGVTGELAHVQTIDGVAAPWAIAESPDGENVYASLRHIGAIGVFARNRATGELTLVESFSHSALIQPRTLKFDANGEFLYIASPEAQSIVVVRRNATTGTLTYVHSAIDPTPIRNSLNSVSYVDLSPDGRFAYATGSSNGGVATFARDSATGMLTFVEELFDGDTQGASTIDGILGPQAVRVSPDGMHVYVAGNEDQAVAVFVREMATGRLTYVQTVAQGGDVSGLIDVLNLTLSPDGDHLYTVSDASNFGAAFRRDRITGMLTFVESYDGQTVAGLNRPTNVLSSPDGDFLYVGHALDTVSVFRRDHAPALSYVVTVASAEAVRNVDFGNRRTGAEIRGTKFNDLDGDGARDASESGLPGWTIYADLNNNGQFDVDEPSDVTDANGNYSILVRPGTHTIREVPQVGWQQTSPRLGLDGPQNLPVGPGPNATAATDLDNDGDLDLAITTFYDDRLNILWNDEGQFDRRQSFPVGDGPIWVAAGDIDGDGWSDLAVANHLSNSLMIVWNAASNPFEQTTTLAGNNRPRQVLLEQLVGDARLDLVVADQNSNAVLLFRNDGNRQFTRVPQDGYAVGAGPTWMAIADFDNNGHQDVVSSNINSSDVSMLLNQGNDGFTVSALISSGTSARSIAAADFDRDGWSDFVTANADDSANPVSVFYNRGDGTFERQNLPVFSGTVVVTTDDMDGDGMPDIVVGRGYRGTIGAVLINAGNRQFMPPALFDIGDQAESIHTIDLNRDGWPEVLVPNNYTNDVSILWNRSGGHRVSTAANQIVAGKDFGNRRIGGEIRGTKFNDLDGDGVRDAGESGLPGWTIYADFDGDGVHDAGEPLSVTDENGEYSITVPAGTYNIREVVQPGWQQTFPSPEFMEVQRTPVGINPLSASNKQPQSVATGDLNGDGCNDLVTANFIDSSVSAMLNRCDDSGLFAPSTSYAVGANPYEAVIVDINRDGHLDVVSANWSGGNMSVLINNGTGVLTSVPCSIGGTGNCSIGFRPRGLVAADLNGDGAADLAVTYDNAVAVLLNATAVSSSSVAFNLATTLGGVLNADIVTAADLNGDGHIDLAAGSLTTSEVKLFQGLGNGQFVEKPAISASGTQPVGLAAGDLNRDGFMDLVVSNVTGPSPDMLSIYFGDGGFQFTRAAGFTDPAQEWRDVELVDIERDGYLDIVVAVRSDDSLRIFRNNHAGGFIPLPRISTGNAPDFVTALDANLDGNIDFAVAHEELDSSGEQYSYVSVFHNLGGGHRVAVAAGQTIDSRDFGNQKTGGEIRGTRFNDLNGNGVRDAGESRLPGWTIYADTNNNGQFDAGEPSDVTDANGEYSITVPPGRHVVRELPQPGWEQVSAQPLSGPIGWSVGTAPERTKIADLNGDSCADLVSAAPDIGSIVVQLNNCDGSFAAPKSYTTVSGTNPALAGTNDVAVADLDGDGDLDVAVSNRTDVSQGHLLNNVALLENDGTGRFTLVVQLDTGSLPATVLATDLDEDGRSDLIVSNGNNSNNLSVWRNLGSFSFVENNRRLHGLTSPNFTPGPISVADFDGDPNGLPDLVVGTVASVAESAPYDVVVYRNRGLTPNGIALGIIGGFGEPVPDAVIASFAAPVVHVATGDVDGDGDWDLAVTTVGSAQVSLYLNDGGGGFVAASPIATGGDVPQVVAFADVDNDGDLDLSATLGPVGATADRIAIWRNTGNGSFAMDATAAIASPTWLSVADLDGDCDVDFAFASPGTDSTITLFNHLVDHVINVTPNSVCRNVDFANRQIPQLTGTIQGVAFDDVNGNGVRDPDLVLGVEPDVVFVIDMSTSTRQPFLGSPVGNVNNDPYVNAISDAELAGFIALNQLLVDIGHGMTADVAIVLFNGAATAQDMNPAMSGVQFSTHPLADANNNGIRDVEEVLRAALTAPGTQFEEALQMTEAVIASMGTAGENCNVVFISDGEAGDPNAHADEVARLNALGCNLRAFGAGSDASLPQLQVIDPDAVRFTTSDELVATFQGRAGTFTEPGLPGWTIYVDVNGNGNFDVGEPNAVTDGNGAYTISGLAAGTHVVREELQAGWTQTRPALGSYSVELSAGQVESNVDFGNRQTASPSAAAGGLVARAVDSAIADSEPRAMAAERSRGALRARARIADPLSDSTDESRRPERNVSRLTTRPALSSRRAVTRLIAAERAVDEAFNLDGKNGLRGVRRIARN